MRVNHLPYSPLVPLRPSNQPEPGEPVTRVSRHDPPARRVAITVTPAVDSELIRARSPGHPDRGNGFEVNHQRAQVAVATYEAVAGNTRREYLDSVLGVDVFV